MEGRVVVFLAVAMLAGCGGGGSTTSFAADGNRICKEDNAKFKALGQPTSSDPRVYLRKLMPLAEEDLSRLKGLDPPSDRADAYSAWITTLERSTDLSRQALDAPSVDAATKALEGALPLNKQADAKAKALGLDSCLTGAGSGSS